MRSIPSQPEETVIGVAQKSAGLAAVPALALGLALGGCGGSVRPPAATAAIKSTCQQVRAVLADGPDPGIDPVGYAQAQVLPLRQLHSSDPALRIAISRLARAYQRFSATQGNGAGERQAVRAAVRKLNASCPGAAS